MSNTVKIIIIIFLVTILGIIGIQEVTRQNKLSEKTNLPLTNQEQIKKNTQEAKDAPIPTIDPQNLGIFTSKKLGINFLYQINYSTGDTVQTQEEGNKVYIYSSRDKPHGGQSVEVFAKNPNDTIEQAIQKIILANYSKDNCKVVEKQDLHNPSVTIATITSPNEPIDETNFMEPTKLCPAQYSRINGIRYFFTDTKHPDKLLFFNIGQYAINGDADRTWQDTLTFLD